LAALIAFSTASISLVQGPAFADVKSASEMIMLEMRRDIL
jgi:hypothetical protein